MDQEPRYQELSSFGRTIWPSTGSVAITEPARNAEGHNLRAPPPSPSSDSIAPTPTSTNFATSQFVPFDSRTHRNWGPKYGRVQKCDFCNGRPPGTLHVCTTCTLHICEECSRSGRWHSDSKHFINPDTCDWTEKEKKRRFRRAQRPTNMRADRGNRGTPQLGSALVGSSKESPRLASSTEDGTDYDGDEYSDNSDNGDDSSDVSNRAFRHSRLPLPSIDGPDLISTPSSCSHAHNDCNGNANEQKGASGNVDDRRGDGPLSMAGPATYGTSRSSILTSAQPDAPASHMVDQSPETATHDQLVLDVYEHIYGHRPKWVPRVRTAIPIRWDGERPQQPQPRHDDVPWQWHYEQFHQYAHVMINHLQRPSSLGPPPPGYESYSFHNYPQYPEHPHTPTQRYLPPARTTPRFHPYNELLPSELELLHNDRQTLREMLRAWDGHGHGHDYAHGGHGPAVPHIPRMRRTGLHAQALQLLWDVFELRRARVDVRDHSQTVCWFVWQRRAIVADEVSAGVEGSG
ncbi:hypothetical protein MMYC01_202825 [Madurella mycetomatis]|uniref:Uncharacterized protein n=1 Tax=Madurella mycetomatis TaxID=100816 RepID=A0A175W8Y2_9PEZI|nr:hypothetical protein MMYC01_202825 [Madurella mycetomatis]